MLRRDAPDKDNRTTNDNTDIVVNGPDDMSVDKDTCNGGKSSWDDSKQPSAKSVKNKEWWAPQIPDCWIKADRVSLECKIPAR